MAKRRPLRIPVQSQGWRQFLTARQEMLAAYDSARQKSRKHKVEVFHGKVAEARFRKWLGDFLPKRFGVASGYIISQGMDDAVKAPHFDVIIYDKLESPVLWREDSPDLSAEGHSLAIPAEFVKGVMEVKSAFSNKTISEAIKHLGDLRPLLDGNDRRDEKYKKYLPDDFFCASVFFELRLEDDKSGANAKETLDLFAQGREIVPRGFIGGIILRGENHQKPSTAKIKICEEPREQPASDLNRQGHTLLSMNGDKFSNRKRTDNAYLVAKLNWSEMFFALFAFELVSRLKGAHVCGEIPSFYGCGFDDWDKLKSRLAKMDE